MKISAFFSILFSCFLVHAQLTTWQAPVSFPSEKYYSVKVNGVKVPVFDTPIASYVIFDFTGMKENGGIFTHTQSWAVMAEAICGNGNRAYDYFRRYMPAAYNTKAEIRQLEPYVYYQSTHSKSSPRYGNSHILWLSGSATWSFVAATQYMIPFESMMETNVVEVLMG